MSKSSPSPQCCEEGHCSQQVWNVRPSRKGSSVPDIYIWWGPPWLNQEHDQENHYDGFQEYLVYKNKKEPKEAVDDALVSVWQRIVALITPWNAKLDWSLLACCWLASQSWLKSSIGSFKTKKNHENTDNELNITLWELGQEKYSRIANFPRPAWNQDGWEPKHPLVQPFAAQHHLW